ncbi:MULTISPECIES: lipopolysaccharide assembly protein LapB [unclassified Streptomyces]|uniref:tetratricopeptide repeat protein n=1 Tax=unclassified Streptomyces TaxID=2593676 RepID=UPI001F0482AA|nr:MULTISPECIES: tetratricopeptide repeat protein [unclassified Streptomyces]MCH0563813.1 tetratricopeptide repeat protein [Streptomyces sp. MUM 2J]MCH0570099.1 tetratricopeptide repeat protein [Streptomyces sp. MUM 136J]
MENSATENSAGKNAGRAGEGSRPRARRRWALIVSLGGCLVLGVVLMCLPPDRLATRSPDPAAGAQAQAALTAGAPAALPDLAVLVEEQETAVHRRPKDAGAWALLGTAYVELGRRTAEAGSFPKAEQALRASLRASKGNPEALDGLAALAIERRDFRAARGFAESALKERPKRWRTYPLLIEACGGLGDHKAVRRALDRMLELHSGPAVRASAAAVYRDRGWREDAAAALADAAAAAPGPAERAAYLERAGELAWERGDREDALRHFRAAVRIDPDQRAAQAGQGRVLAALGRTSEALGVYRIALAKRPDPEYALELGELYESLGLADAARVQYDLLRARVQQNSAGGVDDDLVLGRFEADHGDPALAVRLLRAEWKRQPGPAVADALGWALHRAGADEEALRYAVIATDRAHGGGVRSAPYSYHRGVIERELDRYGPARRHLGEALRINPYFSPVRARAARETLRALGEPSVDDPPGR